MDACPWGSARQIIRQPFLYQGSPGHSCTCRCFSCCVCRKARTQACCFARSFVNLESPSGFSLAKQEVSEGRKHMSGCLQRGQSPCYWRWLINPQPRPSMDLSTSLCSFESRRFWAFGTWRLWEMTSITLGCFGLRNHRCAGQPRCPLWPVVMVEAPGPTWDQIHLSPVTLGASSRREGPASSDLQLYLQTTGLLSQYSSSWAFRLDVLQEEGVVF